MARWDRRREEGRNSMPRWREPAACPCAQRGVSPLEGGPSPGTFWPAGAREFPEDSLAFPTYNVGN